MLVYQRVTPKKTSANHIKQPLHIHADPTVIYTVYNSLCYVIAISLQSFWSYCITAFLGVVKPNMQSSIVHIFQVLFPLLKNIQKWVIPSWVSFRDPGRASNLPFLQGFNEPGRWAQIAAIAHPMETPCWSCETPIIGSKKQHDGFKHVSPKQSW